MGKILKGSMSVKPEDLDISLPSELRGGVYSNLVSMTSTDDDISLDFIYVNPRDERPATVVSRVIMSGTNGLKLLELLRRAYESEEK